MLSVVRLLAFDLDGPCLGVMQNTYNANPISHHRIGGNIGCSEDTEHVFRQSGQSAFGKVEATTCRADNLLVDVNGSPRILCFGVTEDVVAIVESVLRPDEPHRSSALRSAAARRSRKWVLASTSSTSGRVSSSALARNQASWTSLLLTSSNGRAPPFAVRVNKMRTTSETVSPIFSRTAVARSLTAASIRVAMLNPETEHLASFRIGQVRPVAEPLRRSRPQQICVACRVSKYYRRLQGHCLRKALRTAKKSAGRPRSRGDLA